MGIRLENFIVLGKNMNALHEFNEGRDVRAKQLICVGGNSRWNRLKYLWVIAKYVMTNKIEVYISETAQWIKY